MSSKLIWFVVGSAVGLVVGFGLARRPVSEPGLTPNADIVAASLVPAEEVADLKAALARAEAHNQLLETNNQRLVAKVQELRQTQAATASPPSRPAQAAAKTDESASPFAALARMFGGGANDTNAGSSFMTGFMKSAMQQRVDGKIMALKSKLNLSEEQERSIRDILTAEMDRGMKMSAKVMSGETNLEEIAAQTAKAGSSEDSIRSVLTPEQWAGYEAHKKEERANNARLLANSELLELQNVLSLSTEQQDKAFAALFQASETMFEPDPSSVGAGSNILDRQFDQKKEALRAVLTPEQMALYEKHAEAKKAMINSFLPEALRKRANVNVIDATTP